MQKRKNVSESEERGCSVPSNLVWESLLNHPREPRRAFCQVFGFLEYFVSPTGQVSVGDFNYSQKSSMQLNRLVFKAMAAPPMQKSSAHPVRALSLDWLFFLFKAPTLVFISSITKWLSPSAKGIKTQRTHTKKVTSQYFCLALQPEYASFWPCSL